MDHRRSLLSFFKKITWLTLPLAVATLLSLKVKTEGGIPLEAIPLEDTKVMGRALHFIEKNYVDPQAIDPKKMLQMASRQLERNIAPLLVKEKDGRLDLSLGEKKASLPLPSTVRMDDLSSLFGRFLGFLDLFYQGRVDRRERLSLAMDGLVETLDPHSNYLSSKVYNEFRIGTKGNFGGLGIVIGIRENELSVIAPLEGTPAFAAGIRAKDKIVQIGEESTVNMGITEAVERLRGPVGSKVSVVLRRSGVPAPVQLTLTRALIRIQSVAGRLLPAGPAKRRLALIKLKNFQEDTMDQFRKILRSFEGRDSRLDGLILDLRNNPGGLLDQAVVLSDYFLKEGTIVKTVGAKGETIDPEVARPGDPGEKLSVVVLVNEGSASASEIVAGALQQNDRAIVLGSRTFGKGSVQTVFDLKDGSALKLTIANYLTAKDQPVQSIGINPDVGLIPATIDEKADNKTFDLFEEVKKGPPPFQMTYLASARKEEEAAAGKIDLKDDFPVRFAEKILGSAEDLPLDRPSQLRRIPKLLEELKKEEFEKIAAALSKIGVDWSEGEKGGRPVGIVKVEILSGDKEKREIARKGLASGESGFLKITVENQGDAPFYQLVGVTRGEDPVFANLEFPFGRIDPRSKREWKTVFKMPDFLHPRKVPIEIEFHERFGRLPRSSPFSMEIEESPMPHFEYQYRTVRSGEKMELRLKIVNNGKGESRLPVASLKNLENDQAFLEKGREEFPAIPAGGAAEGVLLFRIPPKLKKERLAFDLVILDNRLGETLADRIEIPLRDGTPVPPPETLQSPPRIETYPPSPLLNTDGESYRLKGVASDDRDLRHLFIFVGDEKVFYQPGRSPQRSLPFETTVSLKKGANLITIAAQDDRELASRRQWIVWRKK